MNPMMLGKLLTSFSKTLCLSELYCNMIMNKNLQSINE